MAYDVKNVLNVYCEECWERAWAVIWSWLHIYLCLLLSEQAHCFWNSGRENRQQFSTSGTWQRLWRKRYIFSYVLYIFCLLSPPTFHLLCCIPFYHFSWSDKKLELFSFDAGTELFMWLLYLVSFKTSSLFLYVHSVLSIYYFFRPTSVKTNLISHHTPRHALTHYTPTYLLYSYDWSPLPPAFIMEIITEMKQFYFKSAILLIQFIIALSQCRLETVHSSVLCMMY